MVRDRPPSTGACCPPSPPEANSKEETTVSPLKTVASAVKRSFPVGGAERRDKWIEKRHILINIIDFPPSLGESPLKGGNL